MIITYLTRPIKFWPNGILNVGCKQDLRQDSIRRGDVEFLGAIHCHNVDARGVIYQRFITGVWRGNVGLARQICV